LSVNILHLPRKSPREVKKKKKKTSRRQSAFHKKEAEGKARNGRQGGVFTPKISREEKEERTTGGGRGEKKVRDTEQGPPSRKEREADPKKEQAGEKKHSGNNDLQSIPEKGIRGKNVLVGEGLYREAAGKILGERKDHLLRSAK